MVGEKRAVSLIERLKGYDRAIQGALQVDRGDLTEFLRRIRHDLKTPVNHLIGYSELILEELEESEQPDEAAASDLRAIRAAAQVLWDAIDRRLRASGPDDNWNVSNLAVLRREFREPLSEIIGYCERLQDQSPELDPESIARIEHAARTLGVQVSEEIGEAQLMAELEAPAPPPAEPPPAAESKRPPAAPATPPPTRFGYVLVVDDNEVNRSMLSRRLVKEGYRVTSAQDGRQALQMARAESFDLILLDIMMPELDGYQVLAELKGDAALRDTPVIMISALDDMSSVVRCIETGAEDYLPKPFDPVLLRARIDASLEKKRLRNEELRYLRQVAQLTDAALALEQKAFSAPTLDDVASREDALGRLARTFQRMAQEVQAREQRLERQVQQLMIEIDEARKARDVSEITDSDYFQQLRSKVHTLRARSGGQPSVDPG